MESVIVPSKYLPGNDVFSTWQQNGGPSYIAFSDTDTEHEADISAGVNETGESSTDSARSLLDVLKAPRSTDIVQNATPDQIQPGSTWQASMPVLIYFRSERCYTKSARERVPEGATECFWWCLVLQRLS